MRTFPICLVMLFLLSVHAVAATPLLTPERVVEGFIVPESAVADPESGFVYVSNIEAVPEEYWSDNSKGFISKLNPDGTVHTLRWIDSSPDFILNSPKGLCILNRELYAADNKRVLVFSLAEEKPVRAIEIPGAERLNDMATDGKRVYVTDIARGLIQRLVPEGAAPAATAATLESVNGITFHKGTMFAVSWDLHEIYEIDLKSGAAPQPFGLAAHFTNLDGIEVLRDGSFIVSDFNGNQVCRVARDRKTVQVLAQLTTPADIGICEKRQLLYVPQLTCDKLATYPLITK